MSFDFGPKSQARLAGVHPKLVAVAQQAIILSSQDFFVEQGLRSLEEEQVNIQNGTSHTSQSLHLAQPDGFGHAVDLVPCVEGQVLWKLAPPLQWGYIYPVAWAVKRAATVLGTPIRWGGVWDRWLNSLGNSPELLKVSVGNYCSRHQGPDFLDGPHYELVG